ADRGGSSRLDNAHPVVATIRRVAEADGRRFGFRRRWPRDVAASRQPVPRLGRGPCAECADEWHDTLRGELVGRLMRRPPAAERAAAERARIVSFVRRPGADDLWIAATGEYILGLGRVPGTAECTAARRERVFGLSGRHVAAERAGLDHHNVSCL